MRELRPPGFVRGALSNECPYRDRLGRLDPPEAPTVIRTLISGRPMQTSVGAETQSISGSLVCVPEATVLQAVSSTASATLVYSECAVR